MEEIGGYIELGGFINKPYHTNAIELNTATNAIIYLIKAKKIKKIYLPYYACECLNKIKEYCKISYYKISRDFAPDFNIKLKENEYIYIVNYFGIFDDSHIKKYKKIHRNIIVDNVQAFFRKPVEGIDTIYSCRKYFGVPDGAYLYTDTRLTEKIQVDQSKDRFIHLLGRLEKNAHSYYHEYRENEKKLMKLDLAYMSKTTKLILNSIQYDIIKKRRTDNFKYLNKELKSRNCLILDDIEGAYAYPFYTNRADEIREELIKNKIYVPILWTNVLKQNEDRIAQEYAFNIISLPCDQRYGVDEMNKIVKIIKEKC